MTAAASLRSPVAIGGVTALVLAAVASGDDGPVLCPFRRCTGGYCPGCGATRAAGALARGDAAASWSHHPVVVLVAAQLIALVGVWSLAGDTIRERVRRSVDRIAMANAAALLAIWALRLATGAIPGPFGLGPG